MLISPLDYGGATIDVLDFLVPLWPVKLPLDQWPSFCGAGWTEPLVCETICGVTISPACFDHDCSMALCENSVEAMMSHNLRFYFNLRRLVYSNFDDRKYSERDVESITFNYFLAVSTAGRWFFKSDPEDSIVTDDPLDHPVVQEKLRRLAAACKSREGFYQ